MSRWLQIAQEAGNNPASSSTTQQKQQKGSKRSENLILQEDGCRGVAQQKPARTSKKGALDAIKVSSDLSAGFDPAKTNPINKGENDFLLVSAGKRQGDESPVNKGPDDFLMVSAGCRDKKSNERLDVSDDPKVTLSQIEGATDPLPYGLSPGGRPLTYTGNVVSLADWRQLPEWVKHGPNGRVWNGRTQRWEK